VTDRGGTVLATDRRPTPRGADNLVDTVEELAGVLRGDGGQPFSTVGVGLPGSITRAGVLTSSPNLPGVINFDAASALSERLGQPVKVTNDASCAALAEWRLGAGRGVNDMIMITMGTGIGGGVIADGRLLLGAHGYVGEFGHMMVDPNGPPCLCGQVGCWERRASGSAIAHEAKRIAAEGRLASVVEQVGSIDAIRSEQIVAGAAEGDPDCIAVLDHFARWMAIGLSNLTNAFDPARIVLGGGLSVAAPVIEPLLRQHIADALYASDLRPPPEIRFAELGEHAGAIGAALYGAS
jgi:glucokinase